MSPIGRPGRRVLPVPFSTPDFLRTPAGLRIQRRDFARVAAVAASATAAVTFDPGNRPDRPAADAKDEPGDSFATASVSADTEVVVVDASMSCGASDDNASISSDSTFVVDCSAKSTPKSSISIIDVPATSTPLKHCDSDLR